MKLFKSQINEVFAYEENGSQDHLIGDKTPITQQEADEIIASQAKTLPLAKPTDEELA